jgi:4-hydroxy-tetrahydrodipicolinate synthase
MLEGLPRHIDLLTGNDNFIYESFVMGAEGALIGFGTLATDLQVRMLQLTLDGQWDQAREIWDRIFPLEDVIFGAPVRDYRARTKAALRMLGVIDGVVMRPPMLPLPGDAEAAVRGALQAAGLLSPAAVA